MESSFLTCKLVKGSHDGVTSFNSTQCLARPCFSFDFHALRFLAAAQLVCVPSPSSLIKDDESVVERLIFTSTQSNFNMPPYNDWEVERPDTQLAGHGYAMLSTGYARMVFGTSSDDDEKHFQEAERAQNATNSSPASYGTREGVSSQIASRSFTSNLPPVPQGDHSSDHPREVASNRQFDNVRIRRGYERILPSAFIPPAELAVPDDLFQKTLSFACAKPSYRWIRQDDPKQMLIYTDGSCTNNGQPNAQAGWAFVVGPPSLGVKGHVSGRLEIKGPFGEEYPQTNNRAELRAVLAALGYKNWKDEGFTSVVIATDSEYVANGATIWIQTWLSDNWRTSKGLVKNKDM